MALFVESNVRARAQNEIRKSGFTKKANQIIVEASASYQPSKTFDIFLSHSIRDAELILGMKGIFEDLGYTVYVDWIEDPNLDRSKVTAETAEKLRQRMNSSKSLFFVTTTNAESSKWMPWECGYFDGKKQKVAIVPITTKATNNQYSGQEYLGLYPYIVQQANTANKELLWVRKSSTEYVSYDGWVKVQNSEIVWNKG